ncbi:hypothetical protein, partial [Azospirillum sp. TSH7]
LRPSSDTTAAFHSHPDCRHSHRDCRAIEAGEGPVDIADDRPRRGKRPVGDDDRLVQSVPDRLDYQRLGFGAPESLYIRHGDAVQFKTSCPRCMMLGQDTSISHEMLTVEVPDHFGHMTSEKRFRYLDAVCAAAAKTPRIRQIFAEVSYSDSYSVWCEAMGKALRAALRTHAEDGRSRNSDGPEPDRV